MTMTTSFMVSSIAFDWCIVRRSTLREKNSTTREHHRHVIFIMVRWSHVKWHALRSAVSFYAAVCTVRWMIDAARLIFFRFYKKHLKTTKDTNMNRIQSLFWEKNINNQSEISCLPRWWRNTAVKANCFDFNVLLSSILDFSPLLLALDSCHLKDWRQINPHRKSQWMLLPPPLRLLLLLLQPATAGMVRVRMKYLMFLVRVFAWNHWGTLARCPRPKRLVSIYPLLSSLDLTQVPMAPVAQLFKTLKSRLGCRGPLDRMNGPRGQSMWCQWFQPYGHTCQGWNEWERSILLDHRATQQHSRRHHRILLLNHISFL